MIKKRNTIPFKVHGLEALIRRMPKGSDHFMEELRIVRAGLNGERVLATIFEKYAFQNEHYIFHDLNLASTAKFQVDTLFLSQRGAVILEMKNIAGRISFPKAQNQMKRTLDNGQVNTFECPSIQLERNKMLLGDWFQAHHVTIPIRGAVVFPKPQQQFENIRENLKVLFPLEIPVYLRKIEDAPPILDPHTLASLAGKLATAHREYDPFPICEKYKVDPEMIETGVYCSKCSIHGMQSTSRGWICTRCNHVDRTAHKQAIIDRFMLIDKSMTNKECREFLHLESPDKAMRLMKQMNTPFRGLNKGRVYWMGLKEIESHLSWSESLDLRIKR